MEALYGVTDIMARYGCCRHTASKMMHQMRHMTEPRLMVSESALRAWEYEKTKSPGDKPRKRKERMVILDDTRIPRRKA